MEKLPLNNYIGCLIGGAIGDALGAPIEFMTLNNITSKYGIGGVNDYVEFEDKIGRITDDTQMTIFTTEGLLRYFNRGVIRGLGGAHVQITYHSYLRWLHTQQESDPNGKRLVHDLDGWILTNRQLFKRRGPGITCLSALQSGKCGSIENPINNSKGCGGVMRVAPVGLIFYRDVEEAFKMGGELAAITHGHPSGYLSAGTLSAIISLINQGQGLESAIEGALKILCKWKNHKETLATIKKAIDLVEISEPTFENVQKLGGGWVGEEALAISLFCALKYPTNFEKAITLSINHGGDSDSTGAITGNILGLILGKDAIPGRWINRLEMSDFITQLAEDAYIECKSDYDDEDPGWCLKYPPR